MSFMPLLIDLSEKHIVVIGGGKIAERRVKTLLQYIAHLDIVSPHLTETLLRFNAQGTVTWHEKHYEFADIKNADLIVIATNDVTVNNKIKEQVPAHTLLNMSGEANIGNIIFPAIIQRGKLSISVSTNGASPKLTADIVGQLKEQYTENYGAYVDFLYDYRQAVKKLNVNEQKKDQLLAEVLSDKYKDPAHQQKALIWINSQI